MVDNNDDDLDTSWIEESARITDMDRNYEPEPMDQIAAHFIYINVNNYIEKTKTEYIDLVEPNSDDKTRIITKKDSDDKTRIITKKDSDDKTRIITKKDSDDKTRIITKKDSDDKTRIITKDTLLKIIQQNQTKTHKSKYYLQDILWYNVELKPENIQKSIYSENSVDLFKQFFKIAQLIQIDDIILQPSIFIFHSLQCLYFVFKEKEMEISTHSIKSILKPTQTKPPIQIMDDDVPRPIAHNTKKVRLDIKQLRKSRKKLNPISLE